MQPLVEVWAPLSVEVSTYVGANKTCVSFFSPPGSNTGIGKTTAIDLAKRGARVILACRSKQRGEAALEEVKKVSHVLSFMSKLTDLLPLTKQEKVLCSKGPTDKPVAAPSHAGAYSCL